MSRRAQFQFFLLLPAIAVMSLANPDGVRGDIPKPLTADEVPPSLRPWIGWALDGDARFRCAWDDAGPICDWPSELRLDVTATGARFSFVLEMLDEGEMELPGSAARWPEDVRANMRPIAVLQRDGVPTVRLPRGRHTIDGQIVFRETPESLRIPKAIGIVALTVDGRRVPTPSRREDGSLWFDGGGKKIEVEDSLELEVYRSIEDGVPLRIVTRIVLDASGRARKVELGSAFVVGAVPVSVVADLPVRVEPDGSLTVQVAPGRHTIELVSRMDAPAERLARPPSETPWPSDEVWVFAADDELRQVEVRGADFIDPARTNLPDDFKGLPTYLVPRDLGLELATLRRGIETLPPDNLTLTRDLRLDLSGRGYSVRDQIRGELRRGHRLDLLFGALGRVSLGGEDQLITKEGEVAGVEVRSAQLEMVADSRLEDVRSVIPAVGWSEDVQALSATLHLPPGHMLLAVAGVDSASGVWTERWNLGAIFFVLLVTIALFYLAGPLEAIVALSALVLTWGEPDAPRWVWWAILAFAAITPRLPEGKLKRASTAALLVSALALVIVAAPFVREQIKRALHPQTADADWSEYDGYYGNIFPGEAPAPPAAQYEALGYAEDADVAREESIAGGARAATKSGRGAYSQSFSKSNLLKQDPNATVQTGPGIPTWSFTSYALRWDGPVAADHVVRLFMLTPSFYRLLAVLRVLALLALAYALYRVALGHPGTRRPGASSALLALVVAGSLLAPAYVRAQESPPAEVLADLRARMLRDPQCAPDCVETSLLELTLVDGTLRGTLSVSAGTVAAVRLPGPASSFVPSRVAIDRRPGASVALGSDGFLRVRVPEGAHRVDFEGLLSDPNALQLALGELPRRAAVRAEGYHVQGLRDDGRAEATLRFDREVGEGELGDKTRNEQNLAPWLEVTRTLELGVQWEVVTDIRRVSPPGTAISFSLPLVEGESVTTDGIRQRGARAELSLDRDETSMSFRSRLPITEELTLTAPESVPFSQIWRVRCGAIFACDARGIAPVSMSDGELVAPMYRPFPGDSLGITFSRPEAAAGRATTVDSVELVVSPGVRRATSVLTLEVRSSRGDTFVIGLPEDARVESVTTRGKSQPIQFDGGKLTARVEPGSTSLVVRFQESRGLAFRHAAPLVDLGVPAVNATTVIQVPDNRWLLFTTGPSWGPAVLFWGTLVFILLAAILLSRVPRSPLRWTSFVLLGLGLAQLGVIGALFVAAWFFVIEHRGRTGDWPEIRFNVRQVILPIFTLVVVSLLYASIHEGLLGIPDMQVEGNGSSDFSLRFYVDRIDGALPKTAFYSVPLWVYRLGMLAWALWLAFASVKWAKWAFDAYGTGGYWRASPRRRTKLEPSPLAPTAAPSDTTEPPPSAPTERAPGDEDV
jgi:hypothetical protein